MKISHTMHSSCACCQIQRARVTGAATPCFRSNKFRVSGYVVKGLKCRTTQRAHVPGGATCFFSVQWILLTIFASTRPMCSMMSRCRMPQQHIRSVCARRPQLSWEHRSMHASISAGAERSTTL